ncbi:hypothetical protein IEN85_18775 [Pelagicoccus sp. NFK12]|uniref:DUF6985 domain-containing protein n=1 Tax=Pelagicoccus enzymogenes TaxID=2773457 RepID=A0A927FAL5_9BACT|nr:hypothetical protein [Pelagicoccus enzymogenes]MBD5781553.1 hypothetical protein [Pelagicoccus enzymogenes]
MKIEDIGDFDHDPQFDWYYGPVESGEPPIPQFRFVLEEYLEDKNQSEFRTAMLNFRSNGSKAIKAAEEHIFEYYKDITNLIDTEDEEDFPLIKSSRDVWSYLRIGDEVLVSRRPYGDKKIYLSIECGCDWEEEHGLQIVLKEGMTVNKLGPYDGHLTNSDAYDVEEYENIVYKKIT